MISPQRFAIDHGLISGGDNRRPSPTSLWPELVIVAVTTLVVVMLAVGLLMEYLQGYE